MRRFLIVLFVIITSIALNTISFIKDFSFITKFLQDRSIEIMGILLPINITAICQLYLSMNIIEEKINKEIFKDARDDFKISILVLIIGFIFSFFLIFCKSCFIENDKILNKEIVYFLNTIHLSFFFCYFYVFYEVCTDIISTPSLHKFNS